MGLCFSNACFFVLVLAFSLSDSIRFDVFFYHYYYLLGSLREEKLLQIYSVCFVLFCLDWISCSRSCSLPFSLFVTFFAFVSASSISSNSLLKSLFIYCCTVFCLHTIKSYLIWTIKNTHTHETRTNCRVVHFTDVVNLMYNFNSVCV